MPAAGNPQGKTLGRDLIVALLCGAFVAVMGSLSYAAVPFYSWFCRASGFGGTAGAGALPRLKSPRLVAVRFDSDFAAGAPWSFRPPRNSVELGQVVTASYRLAHRAGCISVGQAGASVGAPTVGLYFEKNNCFCFAPQIMQLGGSREVVLCVDPKRADDSAQSGVSTITLFYTFYPVHAPVPSSAQRTRPPAGGPAPRTGRI